MSYVVAAPDFLLGAAQDLAALGSTLSAANSAAAASNTSLVAAAADEISTRVAALFSTHGLEYQAASTQVAAFHERLVMGLAADANAYLSAEAANAEQMSAPSGRPVGLAAATTRLTLPGAGPLYFPRFITELPYLGQPLLQGLPGPRSVSILQAYDLINRAIGQNWFPGSTGQVVDYPASVGIFSGSLTAPTVNDAVAIGQRALNEQIMNAVATGSPVQVAGLSMGTIVINRELAYLAADPAAAPPAHSLQFAMFSSPELGLAHTYLPNGFTVPLIDYTVQGLPNTQYDVSVVFGQYDFFGNPPDRPWNLPAWVNSLFGTVYYHDPASLASLSDTVQVSSETMPLGGNITTYMVPSPTLPMLLPLQEIGVPQPIVHGLNSVLQPIVDDGYSSLTPGAGPYFSQGALVGVPTAADVIGTLPTLVRQWLT